MSGFISKLRSKMLVRKSSRKDKKSASSPAAKSGEEPTLSIQPHPATTNNPADLQPRGGLATARDPASAVHSTTPGIVIPPNLKDIPIASPEEQRVRAQELNASA